MPEIMENMQNIDDHHIQWNYTSWIGYLAESFNKANIDEMQNLCVQ